VSVIQRDNQEWTIQDHCGSTEPHKIEVEENQNETKQNTIGTREG